MAQQPHVGLGRGPIRFPEEALVPEGKVHLILRTFLWKLVELVLGPAHSVGSDQFVYWNARDPQRKLAPDVFVCLGIPNSSFGSWKIWERRAPDLAVEIISPTEDEGLDWEEKLARYHEAGIQEIVRFDPAASAGSRLRVWDRVDEDLIERVVSRDRTACMTLGLFWVVAPVESEAVGLRLADARGRLIPSALEAAQRELAKLQRAHARRRPTPKKRRR